MTQSNGPYNSNPGAAGVWVNGQFYPDPAAAPAPSDNAGQLNSFVQQHPYQTINGQTVPTSADELPAYHGQGTAYYNPQTHTVSTTYTPGAQELNGPNDDHVQGNLANKDAGQYGGAPGVAESEEARYASLADQAAHQQGAQINNGQYGQDRSLELGSRGSQQQGLRGLAGVAQQYQDQANGNGPSLANQQMYRGIAASNAQQASIAASARGGGANLAAAQQAASNAAANSSGNAIAGAETARAGEQLGAMQGLAGVQQAYGNLATQQRAADLQRQGLSADQAYKQAQLQQSQNALNQQGQLGFEGLRQNTFNAQQQGMEYNESENQNAYMGGQGLDVQRSGQNQAQTNAEISGGATAASALLPLLFSSDIHKKKEIGDGSSATSHQLAVMSKPTGLAGVAAQQAARRAEPTYEAMLQARENAARADAQALAEAHNQAEFRVPSAPVMMSNAVPPQQGMYFRGQPMPQPAPAGARRGLMLAMRQPGVVSDERQKSGAHEGDGKVSTQLATMKPQEYEYRNPSMPGAGEGRRLGIMAQDMERGPFGHQLVKDTPQGKKIDGPGGLSLALAGASNHEHRLRALEAQQQPLAPVGQPFQPTRAVDSGHAAEMRKPIATVPGLPPGVYPAAPQHPSGLGTAADTQARQFYARDARARADAVHAPQGLMRAYRPPPPDPMEEWYRMSARASYGGAQ